MSKDPMGDAMGINVALQEVSDMLLGAVATMVRESWSEEHARQIVVATYVNAMKVTS